MPTVDEIERIMQSDDPIMFITNGSDPIQIVKLCQTTADTWVGYNIPKGVYLLLDEEAEEVLRGMDTISPPIPGLEPIRAFVLPYREREIGGISLSVPDLMDPSIDLIATAHLTGCTVAAEVSPLPQLLHLNLRTADDRIDQPIVDREISRRMGHFAQEGCFTIKKGDYNPPVENAEYEHSATFMGFRKAEGWEYRTQYQKRPAIDADSPWCVTPGKGHYAGAHQNNAVGVDAFFARQLERRPVAALAGMGVLAPAIHDPAPARPRGPGSGCCSIQ